MSSGKMGRRDYVDRPKNGPDPDCAVLRCAGHACWSRTAGRVILRRAARPICPLALAGGCVHLTHSGTDPVNHDRPSSNWTGPPPPQENYRRATEMAFEALRSQSADQLRWLGAEPSGHIWRLPVLDSVFEVDISSARVTISAAEDASVKEEVGAAWRILALHYLIATGRPEPREPDTTFADLSAARSYTSVYRGRVLGRLVATAGRDAERLRQSAERIGGRPADGGDLAFDFDEFPRVSLRLIWHAGDEEFPPSATLLLPGNIESYFCSEDIVVASECLVARLSGKPF